MTIKTKTIRQTARFNANPEDIYKALMNSIIHSKFSGGKAIISNKVGGNFSVYDGYCSGKNLELVPSQKIVQLWRASDWAEGHFSTATFTFVKTKKGTKLSFVQTGVPVEHYEEIKKGWIDYYWTPIHLMFEAKKNKT